MTTLAPFRVGSVPYLNAVPLTCGIENEIELTPPSELAIRLNRGELDAALLSVTAVLFSDRFDVLDGVAIASRGAVKSVLLGHRKPLAEAKEIFCDTASLTSVQLLRVLLAEQGICPEFRPLAAYALPEQMPDYVLLIGDPALDFLHQAREHQIWDLGAAWFQSTRLPFVYAIWALRRGIDTKPLRRLLREAKALGLQNLEEIVNSRTEYTREFRKEYLGGHIRFDLGPDEKRGLAKFIELLRKHGAGPVFEPRFID